MYFDDFEVGQSFKSLERKVSIQDIRTFTELTGDLHKIHRNKRYATNSIFKGLVCPGLLTLSFVAGLWFSLDLTNESLIALVSIDKVNFRNPVHPGDSLFLRSTVISKKKLESRSNVGLLTWKDQIINGEDRAVLEDERTYMIKMRTS